MIKQIVFVLPQVKQTKNRVRYEDKDFDHATVGGALYPLRTVLASAFGKFPEKIKVTIEEVE